eukprot:TRINITY_DN4832_c0_g1_i1.p1 TRINITY_DN4832_c0_g1~~TRINITY_DN4832_c0_g1_i1.p1  ORF type:complete len:168 (-),score=32.32 TRINITY_DN4832_c0_g1_i1:640-1143(-)
MLRSLVGSEMCIRDSINAEYGEQESARNMQALPSTQPKPRSEYTRQFQAYVQDALQGYTPRQGKFHGPIEDMGLTPDQVRHMTDDEILAVALENDLKRVGPREPRPYSYKPRKQKEPPSRPAPPDLEHAPWPHQHLAAIEPAEPMPDHERELRHQMFDSYVRDSLDG